MYPDVTFLWRNMLRAPREPRAAMRAVLDLRLRPQVVVILLALISVITTLAFYLTASLMPIEGAEPDLRSLTPFGLAAFMLGNLCMISVAIYAIGRLVGGAASLADIALAVTWVQVVALGLQVVQVLISLVIPPAGGVAMIVIVGVLGWVMAQSIAEAEGHNNGWLGLVQFFMGVFVMAFVLAILLAILGVSFEAV